MTIWWARYLRSFFSGSGARPLFWTQRRIKTGFGLRQTSLEGWQSKLVPGDWERWQAIASKLLALGEETDK